MIKLGEIMSEFEKLGIDEDFNPFYKEEGIKKPTAVQKEIIPLLLRDRSVLCRAQTGSGKTLAYALPICEKIKQIEDEFGPTDKTSSPFVIIVSPTKELAIQIQKVFKAISHHAKLRTRLLGGSSKKPSAIKTQTYEVLISTPTKLDRALKASDVKLKN